MTASNQFHKGLSIFSCSDLIYSRFKILLSAINSIKNFNYGKFFFHLGPDRDKKIYKGLEKYKTELKDECQKIFSMNLVTIIFLVRNKNKRKIK